MFIDLYKMAPDNMEIENRYFNRRIRQIEGSVINMPYIYDNWNPDYARNSTAEECQKKLDELETLKKIDRNKEYVDFLSEYENRLNMFTEKVRNK